MNDAKGASMRRRTLRLSTGCGSAACRRLRQGVGVVLFLVLVSSVPIDGEPDISSSKIRMFLSSKGSVLAETADTFVEQGKLNRVDPRLIIAIAGAETAFGTRLCAANNYNAWNYFPSGQCQGSTFSSWNQGISTVTAYIRRRFVARTGELTTIEQIGSIYCPVGGCEAWAPNVTFFYKALGGDTSDLRLNTSS
jgi:hypothetical protein